MHQINKCKRTVSKVRCAIAELWCLQANLQVYTLYQHHVGSSTCWHRKLRWNENVSFWSAGVAFLGQEFNSNYVRWHLHCRLSENKLNCRELCPTIGPKLRGREKGIRTQKTGQHSVCPFQSSAVPKILSERRWLMPALILVTSFGSHLPNWDAITELMAQPPVPGCDLGARSTYGSGCNAE